MSKYNVTMKQYNGTGYDELYPKNVGQQVLLNDNIIKAALGITVDNPTINDAIEQLDTNAFNSIETGSYVGTGQAGSSHKNSLTFSFAPRFICVVGKITSGNSAISHTGLLIPSMSVGASMGDTATTLLIVAQNNKTVTWYDADVTPEAESQLNDSDYTYYYIAFK